MQKLINKIIKMIKDNWILLIIIVQPILDIISYFQFKLSDRSFSWIIRIAILVIVFFISYLRSKNKKKLTLYLLPFAFFFIIHILNLYRIQQLNIVLDVKYFTLVFQTPMLTILLIDYIKSTGYNLLKIKRAVLYSFLIIVTSIFFSFITHSYEYTYIDIGILGWFSGSNTPSLILCALAPWSLYMASNHKNVLVYILGLIISFIILYTNATRACYLTLLASLVVMLFTISCSKNESKRIVKICVTSLFILLSIFVYNFSFTSNKENIANDVTKQNIEDIKKVTANEELKNIDFNNINTDDKQLISKILKTSYLYTRIIEIQGEDAVIDVMKTKLSAATLSDNRLSKVINAKIEFNNSDIITKGLGIGYSRIAKHELDLENDIQAIYYYYGYVGITIYVLFIFYFMFKAIRYFIKNPSNIRDKEFVMLLFLIILLVAGGEYSGAFLRKPNANIYLSIYLLLIFFKTDINLKEEELDKKKITFLLLHLGYGGIETATINIANALSAKYNIELVSFYKLKENQVQYINKNIHIKYLYEGKPNREEFRQAVKNKNIVNVCKEGIKAISILIKKKLLLKREISNSNSFTIVSTRYDFSVILNKYGKNNTIKIAQEHHHHNNNKKYIRLLSKKYKNLDYLFALTESLKKDYEIFLKNNNHIKIMVVPNMIEKNCNNGSDLSKNNLISISRLHQGKKINELIDIFSQLEDKTSKLYIIGDGEEKSNLEAQIIKLNLSDRVIMKGYLNKEEQQEYLVDSSIYVMTSESEGLPMVLLEAMNMGIPCIAYNTASGVSDIISNNINGFIIDNRNQELYVKKLNLLLADINLRKQMSINCYKTAKKFSKENVCGLWENILKDNICK